MRLRLNTIISLGTVILILLSLIWSWWRISSADRDMELVDEMRKIAFERILLRDEFLLHREERSAKQWHAKSNALGNLLETAGSRFTKEKDRVLLQDARKDFEASFSGFSRIIEGRRGQQEGLISKTGFSDAEQRQISQVFLKAYSLSDNISRVRESAQIKAKRARDSGIFIVVLIISCGILAIIQNSVIIRRTLVRRIKALSSGVEVIGNGNLDYRIVVEGDDELSQLALASNEMAAQLKLSFTSVDKLEKEISARKKAEREQFRLLNIIEDSLNEIYIFDANTFKFEYVNHGALLNIGYTLNEMRRMTPLDIKPFYTEESFRDLVRPLLDKERERVVFETVHRRKDGTDYPVLAYLQIHQEGAYKVFLAIINDITDRKQMESRLESTIEELQRSNRDLEQFAYVASHDLQEPLRMISSYTQLLAQRYEDKLDEKANLYIHYAVDGAVRMQLLINDLLAYSRIGSWKNPLETVDSHGLLGKAINNMKIKIRETKAIITNDRLPEIRADASQLVQLFQNLISNALKFHGELSPQVHVSAADNGQEWLFSVKDNGIGIDPQFSDKLFVIFQRLHTREEYPGSGIGLAICKKIVERHGGRIWFESEPGKGATFYFTIQK